MVDKVIVANQAALIAKYQAAGAASVQQALQALIAADKARGLTTQCIFVDDKQQMKKVGGVPPVNEKDERGNKLAVDAIATAMSPDYIVLLDGPDVIPHIVLDNPVPNDGDSNVDSDLPYASPAGFSRQVSRYLKVTRVVGRIPNVPGATKPDGLLKCLDVAAKWNSQAATAYGDYYGLSAQVWHASTQMSLQAAFGNSNNLGIAPPAGPPNNNVNLGKLSHFINCHGATASPEFYGQQGGNYPVSLNSAQVRANAVKDTVVAAECCYGAQLYDPKLNNIADPICIAYLNKGALGFLGSTTIAYGPAASNAQADLLTQYFFEQVLAGASLGRSLLQAQLRFITNQKMSNPTNLKTLAQFLLLGDPSVCPCVTPTEVAAAHGISELDETDDGAAQRKERRIHLASLGVSIADSKAVPAGPGTISDDLKERIRGFARDKGYADAKEAVFAVHGAKDYREAMKSLAQQGGDVEESVMVISQDLKPPPPIVGIRHLVAHILGDKVTAVEESVSR